MQDTKDARQPLLGRTAAELTAMVEALGLKRFVGRQLAEWIYKKRVSSIDEMTNLSKAARAMLAERYVVGQSAPVDVQRSADGTVKYLFCVAGGGYVESVFIPDGERATLCVSSQVGCKMGCRFCMTGRQGFHGQLTDADILNQLHGLPERERLTNVVFMGQGEPLDNYEPVLRATQVLTAEWGWGWSPKRITVSSVGVHATLRRFLTESPCHVAISLHNPIPAERAELMPAERAYSITEIVSTIAEIPAFKRHLVAREGAHQRRVSFEYIVFDGYNDTERHARALLELLRPLDCRVNLIRFHAIPDSSLRPASEERMLAFRNYLTQHGLFATIRASRGEDILAACGLLSTQHAGAATSTDRAGTEP